MRFGLQNLKPTHICLLEIFGLTSNPLFYYFCKFSIQNWIKWLASRDCPRFLDQVGHQTTNASIGNRHFSLNNDIVTFTKIMNNLVKDLKILSFRVNFQCLNLVKSFQKNSFKEYLIRRPTFIYEIFLKTLSCKVLGRSLFYTEHFL